MEKKNIKGTLVVIIVLSLVIVGLIGYIAYDKGVFTTTKKGGQETGTGVRTENKEETIIEDKGNKKTYKSYNIGDKVTVKLNDSKVQEFYVLKNSQENEEYITLFAEKNIGTGAFNNDYTDGNEYKGSLIENKVNELTSSWTNVSQRRLITVEEIKATGLTKVVRENRCIEGDCPGDFDYIKEGNFLLYPVEVYPTHTIYEIYWTMTKAPDNEQSVYVVGISGEIEQESVGYKPGSEWNKDGKFFENFGIRPVIEISKEYVE